ncbi:MAG: TIGR02221 family CRISPR-associated protein [Bellilinea sp.]|nr:TIGR02221 family CRISPR-associated protein [Bellilinea sp.]
MTHTVITFMSATPRETTYQFKDDPQDYTGMIFGEALLQRRERGMMPFDRLLLCVTDSIYEDLSRFEKGEIEDEKKRIHLQNVRKILDRLDKVPEVECLTIKTGRDKQEVWDIFNTVIEKIDPQEQVSFDITHGLRSIPFMVFLFAAFLKSAKDVKIEAIYYGAAELSSESKSSPVVDLSPFVEMLDWINATEFFVQAGNAQPLAQLLEMRQDNKQKDAAKILREVSLAASLCQTFTLGEKVAQLSPSLEKAAESFSYTSQPFSVLENRIMKVFQPFTLPRTVKKDKDLAGEDAQKFLQMEWNLMRWYLKNGQTLQAFALAREYIVDLVMWRTKGVINFNSENRKESERLITESARASRESGSVRPELQWLGESEEEVRKIINSFSEIFDTRNKLAHAGHSVNAMRLETYEEKTKLLHWLAEVSQRWQILPPAETPPSD